MTDLETKCRAWGKPPGTSEEQRCQNAETAIKNAISTSDALKNRNTKVFSQGSYANNTNVRRNSDVDVGIVCYDTFFYALPDGASPEDFNISPATYHYIQFKQDIEAALRSYFRSGALTRGNKAFDLHETTYHVEADIAPFFEHRRYSPNGARISGVELRPDGGGRVINWPEQHLANGREKNKATGGRYKALARVLKALSIELGDPVPGFLVECLVWNVPNRYFGSPDYIDDLRAVLVHLHQSLGTNESDEWGEVSELKYLFRAGQKWSKPQAQQFVIHVWQHVGF